MEQLRHGVLRVLLGVGEEHVVAVPDDGEEVPLLARSLRAALARSGLDARPCRVRRQHAAVRDGVAHHRVHDRRTERVADLLQASAHRPAVEALSLQADVLLEPVAGRAERELLHGEPRERRLGRDVMRAPGEIGRQTRQPQGQKSPVRQSPAPRYAIQA